MNKIQQYYNFVEGKIAYASYFPKVSFILFIAVFTTLFFEYNYDEIITYPPSGIHIWRQSDCLSITMNYFQDDLPFLEPEMHFRGRGSGKTMSEFPIIYYTVGKLWQIFGHHEFIFRAINLLIVFCGLFALFKTIEGILKDSIWGILVTAFLFTSPMLIFYANNFIANTPSFGFNLVGWYFFWRYFRDKKNGFIIGAFVFFTLAALLKVTAGLSIVAIAAVLFIDQLKKFKILELLKTYWLTILLMISMLATVSFWFNYANNYNKQNITNLFLIGIYPYWEMTNEKIDQTWDLIFNLQATSSYFTFEFHKILISMGIGLAISFFTINKYLQRIYITYLIGFAAFAALFFQALNYHDYYLINFLILAPIIMTALLHTLQSKVKWLYDFPILKLFAIFILYHTVADAKKLSTDRYTGWMNNDFKKIEVFGHITPYLREINIQQEDKVITMPDPSINNTLYLMDQKGWTNYEVLHLNTQRLENYIELGAKYLLIYDSTLYDNDRIQPFLTNKIGSYEKVDIYSLDNYLKSDSK